MGAITIPILPSPDFDATAGFWAAVGFAETGRWERSGSAASRLAEHQQTSPDRRSL